MNPSFSIYNNRSGAPFLYVPCRPTLLRLSVALAVSAVPSSLFPSCSRGWSRLSHGYFRSPRSHEPMPAFRSLHSFSLHERLPVSGFVRRGRNFHPVSVYMPSRSCPVGFFLARLEATVSSASCADLTQLLFIRNSRRRLTLPLVGE